MQYFAIIYIHPMKANIPHTFLGLTYTHLDELINSKISIHTHIKQDIILINLRLIHVKDMRYNNIYPGILDSNFGGEGFLGFAYVKSESRH